jgi:GNAT superfamily N-acetyltransferase
MGFDMSIILRDVTPDDERFLREVYACTRAYELAMVQWSEAEREAFLRSQFDAQDSHYRSRYPEAKCQLIVSDGEPVGRLYVLREVEAIRILDITVLPPYRNKGIGGSLIRLLVDEAEKNKQVVTVWVEHFNPSQKLFQRFGFSVIGDDGYSYHFEHPRQISADSTSASRR